MEFANVILEKQDKIGVLTINRPKALNALNKDTLLDIKAAVALVQEDPEIDVLVITGSGDKSFVAGADITYMLEMTALEGREFGILGSSIFRQIETMSKPVIAAINGFCLGGGCELAMSCDFRISSDKGKFGQPEVGLGVTPGFGGTQRLPRIVGTGMAAELLYSGDVIDAAEALRIGLVNHVVPAGELMDFVMGLAKKIASRGQISVRLCKKAMYEGVQVDIDRGLTIEADIFGVCFATEEQKEGMKAFVEKRKAVFTGK
ncbi:MAG TPA: crotonase [Syntrophomonas sp.]|jgi:enoyl-CoA hydratase|nr:crotonase [Syntrophomonas sp.]